jgi:hypothetical protein
MTAVKCFITWTQGATLITESVIVKLNQEIEVRANPRYQKDRFLSNEDKFVVLSQVY